MLLKNKSCVSGQMYFSTYNVIDACHLEGVLEFHALECFDFR